MQDAGVRVVLATDNMDTFTRWTVPALGLAGLFDDILCSHDVKCLKGDLDHTGASRFFGPYFAAHGIAPGESVLLDDSKHLGAIIAPLSIDFLGVNSPSDLSSHLRVLINGTGRRVTRDSPSPVGEGVRG